MAPFHVKRRGNRPTAGRTTPTGLPALVVLREWRIVAPSGDVLDYTGPTEDGAWSVFVHMTGTPVELLEQRGYTCEPFALIRE